MSIVYTIKVEGLERHPFIQYLKDSLEKLAYEIDLKNAKVDTDPIRESIANIPKKIPVGHPITSSTEIRYVIIPTDGPFELYVDLKKPQIVSISGSLPKDMDPQKLIEELNEGYGRVRMNQG
ncbi:MAG: hypothetical protein J7K98_03845 [Candidatus Aenigmarchaeota archaeon]|nr:hypothetical protein [Candidatus Aenigmarchaeota archaeon]